MTGVVDFAGAVRQPSAPYCVANDIDWAAVVSDLRPVLLQIAQRVLGDDHGAEDAVQDGLLRAWTGAHRLRDRQALPAWIMTIVRRAALDRLRRKAVRRGLSEFEFDEQLCVPHESARRLPRPGAEIELREEIDRLPTTLRSALLSAATGEALDDYAREAEISYGAAKTRTSRARRELRRRWGTDNEGSASRSRRRPSHDHNDPQVG